MKRVNNMAKMIHNDKSLKEKQVILHALDIALDSFAGILGSNCEVVLHDLKDLSHSIVKIVNGHITGRKIGSPMTDFGLEMMEEAESSGKDIVNGYFNKLESGKQVKSSSCLIRDAEGNPIYMICINIDLSAPFLDFIRDFLPNGRKEHEKAAEHFPLAVNELVITMLEKEIRRIDGQSGISPSDKNKTIILELYKKGFFKIRGAIDITAQKLVISRYTVYNYIREAKVEAKEAL